MNTGDHIRALLTSLELPAGDWTVTVHAHVEHDGSRIQRVHAARTPERLSFGPGWLEQGRQVVDVSFRDGP